MRKTVFSIILVFSLLLFSFGVYAVEPSCSDPTSNTPPNYDPNDPSKFNVTWINVNPSSTVLITIRNSTGDFISNASMSDFYGEGIYNYSIILPAGDWSWISYANDADSNWGTCGPQPLDQPIEKATNPNSVIIYLNGSTENQISTYPNSTINVNAISTLNIPELNVAIFRNGSLLQSNIGSVTDITQWGAGNHNFTAQVLSNENYSDSSPVTLWWNVSKDATSINLYLNGTEGNMGYTSNSTASFNVTLNVSGKVVNLTSNYTGWIPQSGSTPFNFSASFYSVGNWWNLTGFFEGDENYSSSYVTHYFNVTDMTPPVYSNGSMNTTLAGATTLFSLLWTDNAGLSGYIFSFDNCTGTFVNDTWNNTGFSGNGAWSNITKVINSTAGCTIQWKVFVNDISNYWNSYSSSFVTKLVDGSSCTEASQCLGGYCVHSKCRPTYPYCGDLYCDTGEICTADSFGCSSGYSCTNGCVAPTPQTNNPGSTPSSFSSNTFQVNITSSPITMKGGETRSIPFTLLNTLSAGSLVNVTVSVTGLDSSWYKISKTKFSYVYRNRLENLTLTFEIPSSAEAKDYNVTIVATGNIQISNATRTATKTMKLTVTSSQPAATPPITQPENNETLPSVATEQENNTQNVTSNQTLVGPTGLAATFEYLKNNLVIIIAIAACLLIFFFRGNITETLTRGKAPQRTHKELKIPSLKNYKLIVDLKKGKNEPEMPERLEPKPEVRRPQVLEREIKRDIKELQQIIDSEKKIDRKKKSIKIENN